MAQAAYTPEMKSLGLVKELVEQAEEHCNLDTLTLNSAFSGTDIISYLKEKGTDFITRLKRYTRTGKDFRTYDWLARRL